MKKHTIREVEGNMTRVGDSGSDPGANVTGPRGSGSISRGKKGVDSEEAGKDTSGEGECDGEEFSLLCSTVSKQTKC